uniref:Uncharacterized protein n=2 Tax=Bombyx mori TaxID=7091 RepID=A0A8R2R2J3_BOMMO|nr:uncharacterized protein LOC119630274 [Bombyx mori]
MSMNGNRVRTGNGAICTKFRLRKCVRAERTCWISFLRCIGKKTDFASVFIRFLVKKLMCRHIQWFGTINEKQIVANVTLKFWVSWVLNNRMGLPRASATYDVPPPCKKSS